MAPSWRLALLLCAGAALARCAAGIEFSSRQLFDPKTMTRTWTAVAAADVDNDGAVDLVACRTSGGVLGGAVVFLRNMGDGSFDNPLEIIIEQNAPDSVALLDVNRDGRLDVVVAQFNGTRGSSLAWYAQLPTGNGVFNASARNISNLANPRALAIGHFGGDAHADVLVMTSSLSSFGAGQVGWFNSQPNGTMSPTFNTLTTALGSPNFNGTRGVAIGDIDGNGRLDVVLLVTPSQNSGDIFIFYNNGASMGTAVVVPSTGFYPNLYSVALCGVAGTPRLLDIVLGGRAYSRVMYQVANRTFNVSATLNIETYGSGPSRLVACGDFGGDSYKDVVVLVPFMARSVVANWEGPGAPALVDLSRTDPFLAAVKVADFDLDGDADVIVMQETGVIQGYFNRGKDTLVKRILVGETPSSPLELFAGDFAGDDGRADVFVSSCLTNTLSLFVAGVQGDYSRNASLSISMPCPSLVYGAQFGGSSALDVAVVSGGIYLTVWTRGVNSFSLTSNNTAGEAIASIYAADLDANGFTDVLFTCPGSNRVMWLRRVLGSPTVQTITSAVIGARAALTADFDADGVLDILALGSQSVYFLRGLGGGSFAEPSVMASAGSMVALGVGDFDGDGLSDFVVSVSEPLSLQVYRNEISGSDFGLWFSWSLPITKLPAEGVNLALGDFSGDGLLDIAVATRSSVGYSTLLLINAGIEYSEGLRPILITFNLRAVEEVFSTFNPTQDTRIFAADADGDGALDLFQVEYDFQSLSLFENQIQGSRHGFFSVNPLDGNDAACLINTSAPCATLATAIATMSFKPSSLQVVTLASGTYSLSQFLTLPPRPEIKALVIVVPAGGVTISCAGVHPEASCIRIESHAGAGRVYFVGGRITVLGARNLTSTASGSSVSIGLSNGVFLGRGTGITANASGPFLDCAPPVAGRATPFPCTAVWPAYPGRPTSILYPDSGLTVTGGTGSNGGGLSVWSSTGLQLLGLRITGTRALTMGGCAALRFTTGVLIAGALLEGCSAATAGALVVAGTGIQARLRDVIIRNCSASITCGAFQASRIGNTLALKLERVSVTNCSTSGDGGALCADVSSALLQSVSFVGNQAGGRGGAVWAANSEVYIVDSTVADNRALGADGGGGVGCDTSYVAFTRTTVAHNLAVARESAMGGGVLSSACSLEITESNFTSNRAVRGGGAVSCRSTQMTGRLGLNARTARFESSEAKFGGALYLSSCPTNLSASSVLLNNTALGGTDAQESLCAGRGGGGAIYLVGSAGLELNGCVVADNRALNGDGGALLLKPSSSNVSVALTNAAASAYQRNSAPAGGGGVIYSAPTDGSRLAVSVASGISLSGPAANNSAAYGNDVATPAVELRVLVNTMTAQTQSARVQLRGNLSFVLLDAFNRTVTTDDNSTRVLVSAANPLVALLGALQIPLTNGTANVTNLQIDAPPGSQPLLTFSTGIFGQTSPPPLQFLMRTCTPGEFTQDLLRCVQCPLGRASSNGDVSQCSACNNGEFQNATGQSTCLPCAAGRFSGANVAGAAVCSDCPEGRAASAPQQSSCALCPVGRFSNTTGAVNCTACSPGWTTQVSGAVDCVPCPAGRFLRTADMTCVPCAADTFTDREAQLLCSPCSPTSTTQTATGATTCDECPPSTYLSEGKCLDCQAGRFSNRSGLVECEVCPPGSAQPLQGAVSCPFCSAGRFQRASAGLTCERCPENTYSVEGSSSCEGCAPGRSTSGADGAGECAACPPGRYRNSSEARGCAACEPGRFSSLEGSSTCTQCAEGSSTNGVEGALACSSCSPGRFRFAGMTSCAECPAETFATGDGATRCTACQPGTTTNNVSGSPACTGCPPGRSKAAADGPCAPCPIGRFSTAPAQTACQLCPPGTSSDLPGAVACSACAPGRFQNLTTLECQSCPVNTFTDVVGRTTCQLCPNGTVTNGVVGAVSCTGCPPGTFFDLASRDCVECANGTFSNQTGVLACEACAPGRSAPAARSVTCVACAAGRFANVPGLAECVACSAGRFTDVTGRTICSPCSAGRFAAEMGSVQCADCGKGTFQVGLGNSRCEDCAANTVAASTGLSACAECEIGRFTEGAARVQCQTCRPGEYALVRGANRSVECLPCPEGCLCDGGPNVIASKDQWVGRDSDGRAVAFACVPEFCTAEGTCAEGRLNPPSENPLCGQCLEGYYQWGSQCVECSGTKGGVLFLLLLVLLVLVVGFHFMAQSSAGDVKIFMFFVQISLLLAGADVGSSVLFALGIFNFDAFSSSGTLCLAPIDPVTRLLLAFLPPLFAFVDLLLLALAVAAWKRCRARRAPLAHADKFHRRTYLRTALGLLLFTYNPLITAAFRYLNCIEVTHNGATLRVVQSSPAVDCDGDRYRRYLPLVIFILLLLGIVPAALLGALLVGVRRGWLAAGSPHHAVLSFITSVYRAKHYYWEVPSLLRRPALVAAVVFALGDATRYALATCFLVAFLSIQIFLKPFADRVENIAETVSLTVLVLVAVFRGALSATDTAADASTHSGRALAALVFVTAALMLIWLLTRKVRKGMQRITTSLKKSGSAQSDVSEGGYENGNGHAGDRAASARAVELHLVEERDLARSLASVPSMPASLIAARGEVDEEHDEGESTGTDGARAPVAVRSGTVHMGDLQ